MCACIPDGKTKTNVMLKTWKILLIIKGSIIIIIIIIIIAVNFCYYSCLRRHTIEARVYNVCKCLSINTLHAVIAQCVNIPYAELF